MRDWFFTRLEEAYLRRLSKQDRHRVLTRAVRRLFNTVGEQDILAVREGHMTYEGHPLTELEVKMLKEEAKMLVGMKLWKILVKDIEYLANKKMFIESKDEMDLIAGKLWLYTLDTMRDRIKKLTY